MPAVMPAPGGLSMSSDRVPKNQLISEYAETAETQGRTTPPGARPPRRRPAPKVEDSRVFTGTARCIGGTFAG